MEVTDVWGERKEHGLGKEEEGSDDVESTYWWECSMRAIQDNEPTN